MDMLLYFYIYYYIYMKLTYATIFIGDDITYIKIPTLTVYGLGYIKENPDIWHEESQKPVVPGAQGPFPALAY